MQVNCFILCFSVNSISSLGNIKQVWLKEVKRYNKNIKFILVGAFGLILENILIWLATFFFIIGTKSDLREKEPFECIKESTINKMKNDIKAFDYIECSSLTKNGINQVFETALKAILIRNNSKKCTLL